MLTSFRIVGRALWWRRGASAAIFVVAVIAVAAAALGPMYLRSAKQSALRATLDVATATDRDIQTGLVYDNALKCKKCGPQIDAPEHYLRNYLPTAPWLAAPVIQTSIPGVVRVNDQRVAQATIASRQDVCERVTIVSGGCPRDTEDALVSTRSARQLGWQVGDSVQIDPRGADAETFHITGLYQPPTDLSDEYWFGHTEYFDYAPPVSTPVVTLEPSYTPSLPELDVLFTPVSTMSQYPAGVPLSVRGDMALIPANVKAGDVAQIRAVVASLGGDAPDRAQFYKHTTLTALFDKAARESTVTSVPITVVSLDLLVLALFVLFQVVRGITLARSTEVAIAKLRGFTAVRTLRFALALPLILLLAAVPAGVLLAWQLNGVVVRAIFAPGTASVLTGTAYTSAAVAFGGGLFACLLAVRPVLTTRLSDQFRRSQDNARGARGAVIADGIALALAAAGLATLGFNGVFSGGKVNAIALIAPAFVCLAVAVVGVRLLPLLLKLALSLTRETRRIGSFLAVRQLVRRSAALRLIILVAIAFGLATYAISGWRVERENRAVWALSHVGAADVLNVQPPPGLDFQQAVRNADPSGHDAMAVAIVPRGRTGSDPSLGLLAVDTSRLAAVSSWHSGSTLTLADAAAKLQVQRATPVLVGGRFVKLRTTLERPLLPHLTIWLAMQVQLPTHNVVDVIFGANGIQQGPHTYEAPLPPECQTSCRVAGFDIRWTLPGLFGGDTIANFETVANSLTIDGLSDTAAATRATTDWTAVDAHFTQAGAWRNDDDPKDGGPLIKGSKPIKLVFDPVFGGSHAGMLPTDTPKEMPAIMTGSAYSRLVEPGGVVTVKGLDSTEYSVAPAATVQSLPQLLRVGSIVDLDDAIRHQTRRTTKGDNPVGFQVWLSPAAPRRAIIDALAKDGVALVSASSASEVETQLGRQGSALAFDAMLFTAIVAALLATGAAVATVFSMARRRVFELAAMKAMGVSRSALRRACALEQSLLLGVGAALGVLGGVVSAALSLPTVPEFVDQGSGPPLAFVIPRGALLVFAAIVLAIVVLVGQLAARALMRGAVASKLRTAQE